MTATLTTRPNSPSEQQSPLQAIPPARKGISPAVELLASLMDDRFTVPGTQYRIGLDGIVGLIPVVGDLVMALVGSVILKEARRLGASRWIRARMYFNYGIDFLIGIIPVLGDFLDFGFKAHRRNLRLLQQHLDRKANRATATAPYSTPWIVACFLAAILAIGLVIWWAF